MRLRQAAGASAAGSGTHARGGAEPPEASVLRVLVACDDRTGAELGWASRFPRVPDGETVTVTFTAVELLRDLPQLEGLGYVFAGVHSGTLLPPGVAAVDLLIPTDVAHEHPSWWESIADHADQAFPLVFGPVVKLFAELVRIHLAAPEHAS